MINIFAKPAFVNINPSQPYVFGAPIKRGHLMRVSSIIRGNQMAKILKARLNPEKVGKKDVCIYVKPHVSADQDFVFEGKPYLDIIDGWGLIPLCEKHPEVTVITISKKDHETLSRILKNKVICIPQHHLNFEREVRNPDAVTNVGIVGTQGSFKFLPDEIKEGIEARGMKIVELSHFEDREKIAEFYKNLFVQIVWRPYRRRMGNPLKLVNAASFGVPTIALEEEYFKEMNSYYIPVQTPKRFLSELDVLLNFSDLYAADSKNLVKKAEEYHIEKIAKLYKQL